MGAFNRTISASQPDGIRVGSLGAENTDVDTVGTGVSPDIHGFEALVSLRLGNLGRVGRRCAPGSPAT